MTAPTPSVSASACRPRAEARPTFLERSGPQQAACFGGKAHSWRHPQCRHHTGTLLTKTQNSVTENYTYGDNNQLLTAGSKTYAYDDNGNLTSVTVGMAVTSLTWDYNDKLTGITYPNSSTNSFTTNDLGVRTGLTDSGGSSSYLYDGSRVLADSRCDYLNGGVGYSGFSKIYHGDQLGSTRGTGETDQSFGRGHIGPTYGIGVYRADFVGYRERLGGLADSFL